MTSSSSNDSSNSIVIDDIVIVNGRKYEINMEIAISKHTNICINPWKEKLFHGDSIKLSSSSSTTITTLIHSPTRSSSSCTMIPGVLILDGGCRTYGRVKKRLLYKCIPDNPHLPVFLIPYQIPNSFGKHNVSKFVLFRFANWNDEHPHGILDAVLGNINQMNAYYEYQLYRKNLHPSSSSSSSSSSIIAFNSKVKSSLQSSSLFITSFLENNNDKKIQIRTDIEVFTIDNEGTMDFDDAFSVCNCCNNGGNVGGHRVSIYIANVVYPLQHFDLWDFIDRVSNIYLPHMRLTMIPTQFVNEFCSLATTIPRLTIVCDIFINKDGIVQNVIFGQALISVARNYTYNEMESNPIDAYILLRQITNDVIGSNRNSSGSGSELLPQDVVAFWMKQFNILSAQQLLQTRGIFRKNGIPGQDVVSTRIDIDNGNFVKIDSETDRIITNWNTNSSGQYTLYPMTGSINNYVHATSPIRRLSDLVNQILLLEKLGFPLTNAMNSFVEKCFNNLEHINIQLRNIRKIQIDCEILAKCLLLRDTIANGRLFIGVAFEEEEQEPKLKLKIIDETTEDDTELSEISYTYMIYIPEIKFLSRIKSRVKLMMQCQYKFQITMFEDKANFKQKVRLHLV